MKTRGFTFTFRRVPEPTPILDLALPRVSFYFDSLLHLRLAWNTQTPQWIVLDGLFNRKTLEERFVTLIGQGIRWFSVLMSLSAFTKTLVLCLDGTGDQFDDDNVSIPYNAFCNVLNPKVLVFNLDEHRQDLRLPREGPPE